MSWTKEKARRRRERYYELKQALFERLGWECFMCGSYDEPQVDHPRGRDYEPRRINSVERVKRYFEENRRGLIRTLCKRCNGGFKPQWKSKKTPFGKSLKSSH